MTLHEEAHTWLLGKLRAYGNDISSDHGLALGGLVWLADEILHGRLTGRYRFGLPCGMGKTTGIRAVIRTLHQLGTKQRVTVAASQVEQLCQLKKELIQDGVPETSIGLIHSYVHDEAKAQYEDGYASLPSIGPDRQFLLVTHARCHERGPSGIDPLRHGPGLPGWMADRGEGLIFWDESLVVGEALTLPLMDAHGTSITVEAAGFCTMRGLSPDHELAAQWFEAAVPALEKAAAEVTQEEKTVTMPPITEETAGAILRLKALVFGRFPRLKSLVQQAIDGVSFRVWKDDGFYTFVSYTKRIPDVLKNVIVLDASDPIRTLVHLDLRMQRAEDVVPMLSKFKTPAGMSAIKRYDHVTFRVAYDRGSGRKTMRREFFENDKATPAPVEKLVKLIKRNPEKRFLVFIHKGQSREENYLGRIMRGLEQAGIDAAEGWNPDDEVNHLRRVSIETWGRETASNEYRKCDAVVLLSSYNRRADVVAGDALGQLRDINARLRGEIENLKRGELLHSIYQAANRLRMREVDCVDGVTQAKRCDVYIVHSDGDLQEQLGQVLPGARLVNLARVGRAAQHEGRREDDSGEAREAEELARRVAAKTEDHAGDRRHPTHLAKRPRACVEDQRTMEEGSPEPSKDVQRGSGLIAFPVAARLSHRSGRGAINHVMHVNDHGHSVFDVATFTL
jgi:hypothetical protein